MWWWDGGHFDARVAIFSAALRIYIILAFKIFFVETTTTNKMIVSFLYVPIHAWDVPVYRLLSAVSATRTK
jgi:hypothetical protein